ncbi:hypothetical protein QYF36_014399 [Acer negundo]|nr:hypothetical protein QYF36_014399 [Acer negundo]
MHVILDIGFFWFIFYITIITKREVNHVSLHDDIVSKAFQIYVDCFNFSSEEFFLGPKEDRHLLTGLHTVADISCVDCREVLGWKYERAYEASQKYKEGKFILEKSKIIKENW